MSKWGIVSGNWGDVMCDLGYYKKNIGEGNVIYYGNAKGMDEFLKCQSFIHDVIVVEGRRVNDSTYGELSSVTTWENAARKIIKHTDVKYSDLVYASRNYIDYHEGFLPASDLKNVPIVENLNLPESYRTWADEAIAKMPTKDFYLLQPFSINTNSMKEHWPYWGLYLSWLLHDLTTHYLLCGSEWNASVYGKLNNVTNLVDQTPSIMSVYALAEKAKGVISTSNSLAHWCRAQNIPTIICAPVYSSGAKQYFRETVLGPSISFMDYGTSPAIVYMKTFEKFGIYSEEDEVEMANVQELIK